MMTKSWQQKVSEIRDSAIKWAVFTKVERIMRRYAKKNDYHLDPIYSGHTIVVADDCNNDPSGNSGSNVLNIKVTYMGLRLTLYYYPGMYSAMKIVLERHVDHKHINRKDLINTYREMVEEVEGLLGRNDG